MMDWLPSLPPKREQMPWRMVTHHQERYWLADGYTLLVMPAYGTDDNKRNFIRIVGETIAELVHLHGAYMEGTDHHNAPTIERDSLTILLQQHQREPVKLALLPIIRPAGTPKEPLSLRVFARADGQLVAVNLRNLNMFITRSTPLDSLTFRQTGVARKFEDPRTTGIVVTTGKEHAPLGVLMPMVTSEAEILQGCEPMLKAAQRIGGVS